MNFVLTNEEKELLTDISSLLGVKQDTIKQVWEFTIFAWLLKFEDNPEKFLSNHHDILDNLEFFIDDYEVDSYGPIESIDWEEIE